MHARGPEECLCRRFDGDGNETRPRSSSVCNVPAPRGTISIDRASSRTERHRSECPCAVRDQFDRSVNDRDAAVVRLRLRNARCGFFQCSATSVHWGESQRSRCSDRCWTTPLCTRDNGSARRLCCIHHPVDRPLCPIHMRWSWSRSPSTSIPRPLYEAFSSSLQLPLKPSPPSRFQWSRFRAVYRRGSFASCMSSA